jgi:hypothetical protein
LIDGKMIWTTLAKPHERFIGRNPHKPGVETGFTVEPIEVCESLQKSILHRVFGVFPIPGDITGEAEDLIFIARDKLFECGSIACASGCDKQRLVFANDARGERMRVWRTHEVQRPPDHGPGCGFAAKYSTKHLL